MSTIRDYISGLRREWRRDPRPEQMPDDWHRAITTAYCWFENHEHLSQDIPTCELGLRFASIVRWPR